MNKYIFSCFITIFSITGLFSQDLVINLAIEKDTVPVNFRTDSGMLKIFTPYLNISYQNNGQSDIYFKKIIPDRNGFLPIRSSQLLFFQHVIQALVNGQSHLLIDRFCQSQNFVINIGNQNQTYISDWKGSLISQWKVNSCKDKIPGFELDVEVINNILNIQSKLNNSLEQLIFFNDTVKKVIPYYSALQKIDKSKSPQAIITDFLLKDSMSIFKVGQFENLFCFLKAGECLNQRVNLLPLKLIGGTYKFSLSGHQFLETIQIYPTNFEEANKGKYIPFKLPLELNGYSLYIKSFLSNELQVSYDVDCEIGPLTIGPTLSN